MMFATGPCDNGLVRLEKQLFPNDNLSMLNVEQQAPILPTTVSSTQSSPSIVIIGHEQQQQQQQQRYDNLQQSTTLSTTTSTTTTTTTTMINNNIACDLYNEHGLLEEALLKLQLAFHHNNNNNTIAAAVVLRNMAHLLFAKNRFPEALRYCKEALAIVSLTTSTNDDDTNGNDTIDESSSSWKQVLEASLWSNIGNLTWHVEQLLSTSTSTSIVKEEAEYALSRALHILVPMRDDEQRRHEEVITTTTTDRDIVSTQTLLLLLQAQDHNSRHPSTLLKQLLIERSIHGYEHAGTVSSLLCRLGRIYLRQRNYNAAIHFLKEALRVQRQQTDSTTATLWTLTHLGQAFQLLGRNVRAMTCFREALRLKKSCNDDEPNVQIYCATALYNIGMIQSSSGDNNGRLLERRTRALHSFQLCLDLRRRALGNADPSVASVLHNIGILHADDGGQACKSMQCFQESLLIRRQVFGSRHHEVASSLRHIAKIHFDRGDYGDAMRLFLEALWILRQQQQRRTEILVAVLVGLGQTQHQTGQLDAAFKSYQEAVSLLRKQMDDAAVDVTQHMVRVLNIMGSLSLDMMDVTSANHFFGEAARLSGEEHMLINQVLPCAAAA